MRVMDELTESHGRTPSFHHAGAQSPRVGGCVGAFFNMFDWNPGKRFSSARRITADRSNSEALYARRDRSFTERTKNIAVTLPLPTLTNERKEAFCAVKSTLPTLSCAPSPASVKSDESASKRVPGVVARLMGLESLPDGAYSSSKSESHYAHSAHGSEHLESSPPVLLQELLRQEFQHSKKSLKEKLPGFSKRASHDSKPGRGRKKSTTGHFGENAHPYGAPRAPRSAPKKATEEDNNNNNNNNKALTKQPFLARLPAATTPTLLSSKSQTSSPLLSPSMLGGRNTVRLLDAAVKSLEPSMQPSPRTRSCENRKPVTISSRALVNPATKPSKSKTEEMGGSRSRKPGKQDEASRRRFEMALVASAKSPSPTRPRASNSKRVESSPRAPSTTEARKQKQGTNKGEALAMKRTDSPLMRSLLRKPNHPATPASTSQCNVSKPTKSRKKVNAEEDEGSPKSTRHKSIDDVFPELPMEETSGGGASPDLSKTIKAVEEQFLGFDSQGDCRSIERMFGKGSFALPTSPDFSSFENPSLMASPISSEVFVTECGSVPGTFPNSPLVNYEKIFFSSRNHLNLQDMFEVASGDHRSDASRRSFCLSEPQERVLTPSDDEEAAVDLDTCSNSAVCDTGGTPERLEIQKMLVDPGWSEDVMMTPPALKKFEEKLAQESLYSDGSCVEECGQPSPVSVLENPFLDEGPTTPDASLTGDELQPQPLKSEKHDVPSLEMVETEKIKQAILDISRFRNIDVRSIGLEPPAVDPQQELNYMREVLDAANMVEGGEGEWQSMDQSLFERLEFGSIKLDERTVMESKRWGSIPDAPRQGSSIRSERKLLFDSVNEVMALQPWMKTSSFHVDLPMFPDLHCNSKFRAPISGEPLVEEVYRRICHWRDMAGNVLEALMEYDMSVPEGRWVNFSCEVAEIGLAIERMLMKEILEEFEQDLASMYKLKASS